MTRTRQATLLHGRKVVLVTVPEGPSVQADVAFLAGALSHCGLLPSELKTDFCTEEQGLTSALQGLDPAAVLFPYQPEFREIVHHLSGVARAAVDVPVLVLGDGLLRDDLAPQLAEGVSVFAGDPGLGVLELLEGSQAGPGRHAEVPADLEFYGGPGLQHLPIPGSLFLEPGTLSLWAARAARRDLSPCALLARLEAPVGEEAVPLHQSCALLPLIKAPESARRVSWWDRHAGEPVLDCVSALARGGLKQSVRFLVSGHQPQELEEVARAGADRVIFDLDRLEGQPPLPGSSATAEEVLPFAQEAQRLGLKLGFLVVVGLPGETTELGDERLQTLRQIQPQHLRCVPFEATAGRERANLATASQASGQGPRRWRRELHPGLESQDEAGEIFIHNWAACHLLAAEVEIRSGEGA